MKILFNLLLLIIFISNNSYASFVKARTIKNEVVDFNSCKLHPADQLINNVSGSNLYPSLSVFLSKNDPDNELNFSCYMNYDTLVLLEKYRLKNIEHQAGYTIYPSRHLNRSGTTNFSCSIQYSFLTTPFVQIHSSTSSFSNSSIKDIGIRRHEIPSGPDNKGLYRGKLTCKVKSNRSNDVVLLFNKDSIVLDIFSYTERRF